MMDRDYSARAEGDRVPCFEVTSTSGGETYVLRQRQLRDARGAYTTTSGARSRHDSQRLPPGDIAFLSAKAAMETSEDCDAYLRGVLLSLRRVGQRGARSNIQIRGRTTTISSADAARTPVASERPGWCARTATQLVPETELPGHDDHEESEDVRRVPETEFQDLVRCSLDPETVFQTCDSERADERRVARGSEKVAPGQNLNLADVPSVPVPDIENTEDPCDWPSPGDKNTRIPETLFPAEETQMETQEDEQVENAEVENAQTQERARTPNDPNNVDSKKRGRTPLDTRSRGTSARTPNTGGPGRTGLVPTAAATPFTELRLTEDGLFSPAEDPGSASRVTRHARSFQIENGLSTHGAAFDLPSPLGEGGALRHTVSTSTKKKERSLNAGGTDAYFANMHRAQQSAVPFNKERSSLEPRDGDKSRVKKKGFTYPSPAAAHSATPWRAPRLTGTRRPGGGSESPGDSPYRPNLQPTKTPPRVGNLHVKELVAMPAVFGAVSIRTADVALGTAGTADGFFDEGDDAIAGGDAVNGPARNGQAVNGDAPDETVPNETAVVPDTFAPFGGDDDDDADFERLALPQFAFRGGCEEEPDSSPAAMAVCDVDSRNVGVTMHDTGHPSSAVPQPLAGTPGSGYGKAPASTTPFTPKTGLTNAFNGFTTGNGRAVAISENARIRATRFLDDTASKPPRATRFLDDSAVNPGGSFAVTGGFVTTTGTGGTNGTPNYGGFKTGPGTEVLVSDAAMAKARRVLDAGLGGAKQHVARAAPTNSMFSTGSGNAVHVSAAAMAKASHLFGDTTEHSVDAVLALPPASSNQMFSTGSGNAVHVSAAAMAKASHLFGDPQPLSLAAPAPFGLVAPALVPTPTRRAPGGGAAPSAKGGFQSPMLAGVPRLPVPRPPASGLGDRNTQINAQSNAPAIRRGDAKKPPVGAPSVHDLFSGNKNRVPMHAFFSGLAPHERTPSAHSVSPQIWAMTSDTAVGWRVPDGTGGVVGSGGFHKRMLTAGCVARLLDMDWVVNAVRFVVWHHSCVTRSFPSQLTQGLLTADAVTQRLLYKYEREILGAKRPWTRRVWERDTPSSAPAVLVVSAVRRVPTGTSAGSGTSVTGDFDERTCVELELSDGWYGVAARCDKTLTDLVKRGALRVGQKILVQGLELMPKEGEPVGPLAADADDLWLALRANQVRPAPWDAKLGSLKKTVAVPLRNVTPDGGLVSKLLVFVERVYPPIWIENGRSDGKVVHRNETAEVKAQRRWDDARSVAVEKIAHRGENGETFDETEDRVREALTENGLLERRSSRSMKLQVSGVTPCQKNGQRNGWTGAALLTAYEVDADAISAIEEGTVWEITDVSCRGRSSSGGGVFNSGAPGLELTVGRRSSWRRVSASALQRGNLAPSPVPRRLCTVRDLSEGHDDGKVKLGEEFDAVAVVVYVSPPIPKQKPTSQWVFLVDHSSVSLGFGSQNASSKTFTADLLAVEIDCRHPGSFVDATEWGGGAGFENDKHQATTTPVFLENLRYTRLDARNGVRVAAFTDLSRATPMNSFGKNRTGPSGRNAPEAEKQARALLAGFGVNGSVDIASLRTRVRLLTENPEREARNVSTKHVSPMDAPEPATTASVGVTTRRASLRRKRSLSLGSDADWGASQLDVIERAEVQALELRRQQRALADTLPSARAETQ